MAEHIIEVSNLKKSFNGRTLFTSLNLKIEKQSVTAVTGKNGSGKTTLIKILAGLILPDAGKIIVSGVDATRRRKSVKKMFGVVINPELGFYPQLSVYENIKFISYIYKARSSMMDEVIEKLSLEDFLDTKFAVCSSGIKHRLSIAAAIINKPEILLLDELTRSIDMETSQKIYELIGFLNKESKTTVFFATHDANEVKKLAHFHYNLENRDINRI